MEESESIRPFTLFFFKDGWQLYEGWWIWGQNLNREDHFRGHCCSRSKRWCSLGRAWKVAVEGDGKEPIHQVLSRCLYLLVSCLWVGWVGGREVYLLISTTWLVDQVTPKILPNMMVLLFGMETMTHYGCRWQYAVLSCWDRFPCMWSYLIFTATLGGYFSSFRN